MLKQNPKVSLAYIVLAVFTIVTGYYVERTDIWLLLGSFSLMFIASLVVMRDTAEGEESLPYYWGMLMRLLLLFSFPALSDDIYRFIWDGRLLLDFTDPYKQLPSHYVNQGIEGVNEALYLKLNSREYFSVYPPFNQIFFFLSALFSPNSEFWSAVFLRVIILAFEVGNIRLIRKLLRHYQLPEKYGLLYALNPMVILELTGNLHFEAIMIFFLLLALWYYEQHKLHWSAVFLGMSVATKFLPLIFLPLLFRRIGFKKTVIYSSIVMVVLAISFLPLINTAHIWAIGKSLELYFQKFEFNASIYYIARWYGFELAGHNIIEQSGKWMMGATFVSIMLYALLGKKRRLPEQMMWVWALYLLFATTVHPWYIIPLLVLSIFSLKQFPFVWTILVFFTYANYQLSGYFEWLEVVMVEYIFVILIALYETSGRSFREVFFK
jgi:hypothetical protein